MLDAMLRRLTRVGIRRGMSGSRVWLTTAAVALGIRALRRLAREEPEVLYRTRIRRGDRFAITSRAPDSP